MGGEGRGGARPSHDPARLPEPGPSRLRHPETPFAPCCLNPAVLNLPIVCRPPPREILRPPWSGDRERRIATTPFASDKPSRMWITLPGHGRSGTPNHGRSGTKTREIGNTQHLIITQIPGFHRS